MGKYLAKPITNLKKLRWSYKNLKLYMKFNI